MDLKCPGCGYGFDDERMINEYCPGCGEHIEYADGKISLVPVEEGVRFQRKRSTIFTDMQEYICPNCKREFEDEADIEKFCPRCGKPLEVWPHCFQCDPKENGPWHDGGERYCGVCGSGLGRKLFCE